MVYRPPPTGPCRLACGLGVCGWRAPLACVGCVGCVDENVLIPEEEKVSCVACFNCSRHYAHTGRSVGGSGRERLNPLFVLCFSVGFAYETRVNCTLTPRTTLWETLSSVEGKASHYVIFRETLTDSSMLSYLMFVVTTVPTSLMFFSSGTGGTAIDFSHTTKLD